MSNNRREGVVVVLICFWSRNNNPNFHFRHFQFEIRVRHVKVDFQINHWIYECGDWCRNQGWNWEVRNHTIHTRWSHGTGGNAWGMRIGTKEREGTPRLSTSGKWSRRNGKGQCQRNPEEVQVSHSWITCYQETDKRRDESWDLLSGFGNM